MAQKLLPGATVPPWLGQPQASGPPGKNPGPLTAAERWGGKLSTSQNTHRARESISDPRGAEGALIPLPWGEQVSFPCQAQGAVNKAQIGGESEPELRDSCVLQPRV